MAGKYGPVHRTDDEIVSALEQTSGLVFKACAILKIGHTTFYRRMKRSKRIREALERERGLLLDDAENQLNTKVRNGEFLAVQFVLKTLGRTRGYTERPPEPEESEQQQPAAAPTLLGLPADAISPAFNGVYRDIRNHGHTEYLFYGGRGSTKSSFISLVIIDILLNNPNMHALAARQVANTLRDSVYSQISWAIDELGLGAYFRRTTNPMEMTYQPTGQKIYFRGADDPLKIKSIKPPFGYIGLLWLEELDQFRGPETVRNIEQSVIRGGDTAYILKSFNPPRTVASWVNKYTRIQKATQYQHRSDYTTVPSEWLGKVFVEEAAHIQQVNPLAYEHEYLGLANGTGGTVFSNLQLREITDQEISQFDRLLHGLDWGFFPDPAHYTRCYYHAASMTLYIFGELRRTKTGNRQLYDDLVEYGLGPDDTIIADSAEPKSVSDFRSYAAEGIERQLPTGEVKLVYGPGCRGAEKGPESVRYSMKWLQSLVAIVVDPRRCPETAIEFAEYEMEQDADGNYISEYPDRNNHGIDSVRYATNAIWRRKGQ